MKVLDKKELLKVSGGRGPFPSAAGWSNGDLYTWQDGNRIIDLLNSAKPRK